MILAIDLGKKTTGLAISEGILASPYLTIRHRGLKEAVGKVVKILDQVENDTVDKVVVGFVEGKIKKLFEDFVAALKKVRPNLEIVLWDETLTTGQARKTMIKLQLPKMKRAQKEHEVAAAIILQSYLDSSGNNSRGSMADSQGGLG